MVRFWLDWARNREIERDFETRIVECEDSRGNHDGVGASRGGGFLDVESYQARRWMSEIDGMSEGVI